MLTIENVHVRAGWLRVVRHTGVVTGVVACGAADVQRAGLGRALRGHVYAPVAVVVHHTIVVIPEHVHRRLRTLT